MDAGEALDARAGGQAVGDDTDDAPPLNRARIEGLLMVLAQAVKAHYLVAETEQQTLVYEALNALACQTALVIGGAAEAGGLHDCLNFFAEALSNQVNAILVALAERANAAAQSMH
jgi:hypothetical protein